MLIFPHPSVLESISAKVASGVLSMYHLDLFANNVYTKIRENKWDLSDLKILDANLFKEIIQVREQ